MKTFLLVGNYGVGNLGDEALKEYFLRSYPEASWKVVSANPEEKELPRLPWGIRSFFHFGWMRTLRELKSSDGVVFGGGSLFTDTESVHACFLWGVHALAARIFRKPVFLAFQGVGPFRTAIGERIARKVVQWSDFVSVRDHFSYDRIQKWKLNKNIVLSFDPVFSLIKDKNNEVSSQNILIVIPRKNSNLFLQKMIQETWDDGSYESLTILSLQSNDRGEMEVCQKITDNFPSSQIVLVHTLADLAREVARGRSVLTERYHGAIAAIALGKSFSVVPQGKEDKLSSLSQLGDSEQLSALLEKGDQKLREAVFH